MKTAKVRNFSALEVANICGVVNQTAINWIKKGYLRAHRTPGGQYRVYGEDLVHFMNSKEMDIPKTLQSYHPQKKKTVLFIDDNNAFAESFLSDLTGEFPTVSVHRASDSFEAGFKLAANDKDLILINGDMDGLDARKICRLIRSTPSGEEKSIIVFTDVPDLTYKVSLLEAGADVYIKKPFDVGHISIYME